MLEKWYEDHRHITNVWHQEITHRYNIGKLQTGAKASCSFFRQTHLVVHSPQFVYSAQHCQDPGSFQSFLSTIMHLAGFLSDSLPQGQSV